MWIPLKNPINSAIPLPDAPGPIYTVIKAAKPPKVILNNRKTIQAAPTPAEAITF